MKQNSHLFAIGIMVIIGMTGALLFIQKSELGKGLFGIKFKPTNITAGDMLKKEVDRLLADTSFESEVLASAENARFKVLMVGNGMDKNTLKNTCLSVIESLKIVSQYSKFADQIEFTCGKFNTIITGAGGSPATAISAQAKLFLMADAKRTSQNYTHAVILENSKGTSYAVGSLSSAIVFTEDKKNIGLSFLHAFSHIFACLADENIDEQEKRQTNNITSILGLKTCVVDENCVEKPANGCTSN